jgi:hypothetical protein
VQYIEHIFQQFVIVKFVFVVMFFGKKVALLALRRVGFERWGKAKCATYGLAKIVFKKCAVGKK